MVAIGWLICRMVINVKVHVVFVDAYGVLVCRVVDSGNGRWFISGGIWKVGP